MRRAASEHADRMLVGAVVAGIALGLLFGRRDRASRIRIAWWPLLVGAVGLRLVAPALGGLALIGYLFAFAAILGVAIADIRLPGMWLIALGAALNLIVVLANGAMPVDTAAAASAGASLRPDDPLHRALGADDRLTLMADVIPVPPLRNVYSVGDLALAVGGFWLPFRSLTRD